MELSAQKEGATLILSISGTLDSGHASRFREEFLDKASEETRIILECGELTYLDSSGLAILVNIQKGLAEREARMIICGLSEDVLRVIRFTKLDRVFSLAETPAEALAELSR